MAKNKEKHYWSNVEAITAIFANVFLFFLKLWAGSISGSIGIIADAWHTLSDSFSSVIILISIKISRKPPDRSHPFGHGRAEIISSVIIGTLIAVIGFNFLLESIHRFNEKQAALFSSITIIVIVISIVGKELLAQFAFWCSRKSGSMLIKADAWHHRSDALSSVVVLVGILLGKYLWWIDSVLGVGMSLLLFFAAWQILRSSISKLLGEPPDTEITEKIIKSVNQIAGSDTHPHHFHCHTYGDHKELSFHIVMDPERSLKEVHDLTIKMESALRTDFQIEATIHVEPKMD